MVVRSKISQEKFCCEYVSNPDAWNSFRMSLHQKSNDDLQMIKKRKPVSLLVFYLIFLKGAGFLWLVPKR
jgi:hypothetical protein